MYQEFNFIEDSRESGKGVNIDTIRGTRRGEIIKDGWTASKKKQERTRNCFDCHLIVNLNLAHCDRERDILWMVFL